VTAGRRRIPVRVTAVKDIKGNQIISVMMDLGYFMDPNETYQVKIDSFKEQYLRLLRQPGRS